MALPTDSKVLTNLAVTTMDDWFRDNIADNFFTTNPLITRLLQLDGGRGEFVKIRGAGFQIRENIRYNKIAGGSYNGASTFATNVSEYLTAAIFQWKGVYVPINLDERDVAKNAGNSELQFFDYVESVAQTAQDSLLDLMGYQLYGSAIDATGVVAAASPDLSIDFDGLFNALDSAAFGNSPTYSTYGGIPRSGTLGDPGFAVNANIVSAGTIAVPAPLTKSLLNAAYTQAVFNQSRPDIGICRRDLWNQLWERVESQDRNPPGPLRNAGFETIRFNGAEVVTDDHQLPGVFDWLTSRSWHLWLLDGRDLVRRGQMYGFSGGFPVHNQPKEVDQLILDGNMVCCSPRLNTHIINIKQG